jgi:hypothetical protein
MSSLKRRLSDIKFTTQDGIRGIFICYQLLTVTNSLTSSWDEWVPEDRVLKYNEFNIVKQKELKKAQEAAKQ